MREKVRRLARGVIESEEPVIDITPLRISETISNGRINKAEILLKSTNRRLFRGLIYTSNTRVKLLQPYFAGTQVYLGYNVDCAGLPVGDKVTGRFEIVSNAGEFIVPFTFTVSESAEQIAAEEPDNVFSEAFKENDNDENGWSDENGIFIASENAEPIARENDEENETRRIINEAKEKLGRFSGDGKDRTDRIDEDCELELLSAICTALIKEKRRDEEAFIWYKRAVEKDVNLTGLYDYYLASLPAYNSQMLPREIYMYFSFNPPEDDNSCKKLYKSVVRHFGTSSPTYLQLEGQIRQFAIRQILEKHIDEDLAEIYRRFLSPEMVDERMAGILPDILITHMMDVPSGYTRVIINYDELNGEQVVAAENGKAYFPLYTLKYHLTLSDNLGHKKTLEAPLITRLLPDKEDVLDECVKRVPTLPAHRIAVAHRLTGVTDLAKEQFDMLMDMAQDSGISNAFKAEIKGALIRGYNWSKHFSDRPVLLELINEKCLSSDDRSKLLNQLLIAGYVSEAEGELRKSGYENVDSLLLSSVCDNAIDTLHAEYDEFLVYMAYYIYKNGNASALAKSYLARHYNGLSDDMYELLIDTLDAGQPVYDLPERLLGQYLFVNRKDRLDMTFRLYAEHCSVDRTLLKAYYSVKAHFYFMDGEPIDEELFEAVKTTLAPEILTGSVPVIIQLAISRYCSEKENLSEEDAAVCKAILTNLIQKGIMFPFFKNFSRKFNLPEEVKDKTMVSYRGNSDESVALIITPEDDEEEPVYMEMTYVYEGLFVKSILLCEGECEHYEIRVTDKDGNSRIVKEGELKADISDTDESRRFIRLNALIKGSESPSDPGWQSDMEKYAFDDTLNAIIFK